MQQNTFIAPTPKKVRDESTNPTTDQELTFNWDELPENVQSFVVEYGLKQIIGDAISGIKDADEAADKVRAKAAALREGTVKMSGGGGRAKSEVERETEEQVARLLKQAGKMNMTDARKAAKDPASAMRDLIAFRTGKRKDRVGKAANEKLKQVREYAEKVVNDRKGLDIDLSDDVSDA
jgi:hypothetical protein